MDDPSADDIRTDVGRSCRLFTGTWPLADFISANPLDGLVDEPFTEAARIAGEVLGARTLPPESWLRRRFDEGRVNDGDLERALETLVPEALSRPSIALSGTVFAPDEILLAELHDGLTAHAPHRTHLTLAERFDDGSAAVVDSVAITVLAGYFGDGQAKWTMPGRGKGLFAAWRGLAPHTPHLPRSTKARLRRLPAAPEAALADGLAALGIPRSQRVRYLTSHLACLPGWTSRIRGRRADLAEETTALLEYLAMRVSIEAALLAPRHMGTTAFDAAGSPVETAPTEPSLLDRATHLVGLLVGEVNEDERDEVIDLLSAVPTSMCELIWLEAYEGHYREELLTSLEAPHRIPDPAGVPAAQVACCIDNRAEGLRRHLEALGDYQTMGFAGFFSVAMRFARMGSIAHRHQHPGPGTAQFDLTEVPAFGQDAIASRHITGRRASAAAHRAWHSAETIPGAPFVLAEATGWAAGPIAAARTLAPLATSRLASAVARRTVPDAVTTTTVSGLPRDVQADTAQTILSLLGLTSGFSRLVVFVGHSSSTTNNPYQAVLDCGACGGHPGAPNARAAAELLNRAQVRADLADRGISIPPTTFFLPAEHNTTTDVVTVLDPHSVPADHRDDVARLEADLDLAGAALAQQRIPSLPGAPDSTVSRHSARRHARTRSVDWAQAFPEWGLAGNTATIIAPRSLTRGVDLGGRVFLHDYDHSTDDDGSVLETLLLGPTIVAQWISCQYYFSAVDHRAFGAGTKTLHNVVGGGQGVMAGPTTDLQIGLPWQSLSDGERLRHEPMRMLTLVEAPIERLSTIIAGNEILDDLASNGWITLCARDGHDQRWRRFTPNGWQTLLRAGDRD